MSVDERRREELRRATGEAAAAVRRELAAADAAARRPGDLVLLPATAEQAVEWLLAERDGDRWLLVPADVDPWVGSADLEVPGDEIGGPLVLRCRHALWADAALLADAVAGGRVEAHRAAAAAERFRQAEAGTLDGSPLERETDDDPAYRRRDAEVATAHAVLATAALAAERSRQAGRFGSGFGDAAAWRAAAAVLLVALAGTNWWAVGLRSEVDRLGGPRAVPRPDAAFELMADPDRGPKTIEASRSGDRFAVRVYGGDELRAGSYRLELAAADGEVLASFDLELATGDEYTLDLPADRFPAGDYELLLIDPTADPPLRIEHHTLVVPAA